MPVMAKVVIALAKTLDLVLRIYIWIIIIGAIISWVDPDPYHPVVRTINRLTEPVLKPIRRIIPPIGGLDFSPVVAIFLVYLIQILVIPLLYRLAFSLT